MRNEEWIKNLSINNEMKICNVMMSKSKTKNDQYKNVLNFDVLQERSRSVKNVYSIKAMDIQTL